MSGLLKLKNADKWIYATLISDNVLIASAHNFLEENNKIVAPHHVIFISIYPDVNKRYGFV